MDNLQITGGLTVLLEQSLPPSTFTSWSTSIEPSPTGFTTPLTSIVSSGNLYLAVGGSSTNAAIYRSSNGNAWTSQTISSVRALNDVVWAGGQFVAVGGTTSANTSYITTSPDGSTWTSRLINSGNGIYSVAHSGSTYAAGGFNGRILTSTDGEAWTDRTSGITATILSIIWDGSKFIAYGAARTTTTRHIITSTDGITWETRYTSTGVNGVAADRGGLAYSGSVYVLVATNSTSPFILSSPDGISWTSRTPSVSTGLSDVMYDGSKFIAITVTGQVTTSTDGENWTTVSSTNMVNGPITSGISINAISPTVFDGQVYAVGDSYSVYRSSNATDWYVKSLNVTRNSVNTQTSKYLVGSSHRIISYSDDKGANWKTVWTGVSASTTSLIRGITWNGTTFVAVGGTLGGTAGFVITSPDGVTWTAQAPTTTGDLSAIAWSGSMYVAVGGSASGVIIYSTDAITWTIAVDTGVRFTGVVWTGAQFVAVGISGRVVTSPDGITWTAQTSGIISNIADIGWNGSLLVALVGSTSSRTSTDGVTWTTFTLGIVTPNSITWSGDRFIVVGNDGALRTSTNGTTWTAQTSGVSTDLTAVSANLYDAVAAGPVGVIIRSIA
jgi:hypothetical protein